MMELDSAALRRIVAAALEEDLGSAGDLTTDTLFPEARRAVGYLVARQPLVLAGLPAAREVFHTLDPSLTFEAHRRDGERVDGGERVATVSGDVRTILRGERSALNFLTRMCGVATATRAAVEEIAGTRARILDTRKTVPGWRLLDKYAVAAGGGLNHRMGLYDAVMIKDTHLAACASIGDAVAAVRRSGLPADRITVEVQSLDQLGQAILAGAGRALLDNMDLETLGRAVQLADGRIVLEASGGLRPGHLRPVADTGVDYLSLGWLTHSAGAADLAMDMEPLS
jgi:nicotinate-nucleotide pyrophosphorylase (carboxylating)